MRVTHPFHPLNGKTLSCVGERNSRYGTRLLLRVDERNVCSVPRQWTDVEAPDPEIVLGKGRAVLRLADFLELADFVRRLLENEPKERRGSKAINAASVKLTTPHAKSK